MKEVYTYLIIIIQLLVVSGNSIAQTYTKYWDRTYGGNEDEGNLLEINQRIQIIQNLLYVGSTSNSGISGNKSQSLCDSSYTDCWIMKLDTAGTIIWDKDIGGRMNETFADLVFTKAGNFIMTTSSQSDTIACQRNVSILPPQPIMVSDCWMPRLDTSGNIVDEYIFTTLYGIEATKIDELTTGEFITVSSNGAPIAYNKTVVPIGVGDFWVVKFDSIGNKKWDKVYGGTNGETPFDIVASENGSFVIVGETLSPIGGTISIGSLGSRDGWIIKIDNAGNKLWDKRYGTSGVDYLYDIITLPDGGYAVCGTIPKTYIDEFGNTSLGRDYWIMKLDSVGNKVWEKSYGNGNSAKAYCIQQTYDGGFWVGGSMSGKKKYDVSEDGWGTSNSDYWILRLDSMGNKLFDKRLGAAGEDFATSIATLGDSSIVICGTSEYGASPEKSDTGKGGLDLWLIKMKYIPPAVSPVGLSEQENLAANISLYPNPATNEFTVYSSQFIIKQIGVFNVLGEKVSSENSINNKEVKLDVSPLPPGMYFVKVFTEQGVLTKKFLKQ